MDEEEALTEMRLCIGSPPTQGTPSAPGVSNYTLSLYLNRALVRLASALKWRQVDQPTMLALQEDIFTYPLPPEVMRVITVRIGNQYLIPDSIWRWERDALAFETATSSTPSLFCVKTRNLLIYPPPDSDTINGSNFLSICYLGHSPKLEPTGVPGLVRADMLTAVYDAAREYDGANPGATKELQAQAASRARTNDAMYQQHLHDSKSNWEMNVALKFPRFASGGRIQKITR